MLCHISLMGSVTCHNPDQWCTFVIKKIKRLKNKSWVCLLKNPVSFLIHLHFKGVVWFSCQSWIFCTTNNSLQYIYVIKLEFIWSIFCWQSRTNIISITVCCKPEKRALLYSPSVKSTQKISWSGSIASLAVLSMVFIIFWSISDELNLASRAHATFLHALPRAAAP